MSSRRTLAACALALAAAIPTTVVANRVVTATAPPDVTPLAQPADEDDALAWMNYYRSLAGLAPVTFDPQWNADARHHAEYLHRLLPCEPPGNPHRELLVAENGCGPNPFATVAGDAAASGVITGGETARASYDGWMTAPFHALGLINPNLEKSSYGEYHDPIGHGSNAVADVGRGATAQYTGSYPIVFPSNLVTTSLTTFTNESPSPFSSQPANGPCRSWEPSSAGTFPSAPVIVQYSQITPPAVTGAQLSDVTNPSSPIALQTCAINSATYDMSVTGSPSWSGGTSLGGAGGRQSAVFFAREPFVLGHSYELKVAGLVLTHFTIGEVPSTPVSTATLSGASVVASWTTAAKGSPITGYTATLYSSSDCTGPALHSKSVGTATSTTFALASGATAAYSVRVVATAAAGSNRIHSCVLASAPAAPTMSAAPANPTSGNGTLTVQWAAPPNPAGFPVTGYEVKATGPGYDTAFTVAAGVHSRTYTGLTNGAAYTFAVRAINAIGLSPASAPVVGTPFTTPSPVTNATAHPADGALVVTWPLPSSGGSPIISYNVTCPNNGLSASTSPWVVCRGLVNGVTYPVRIVVKNAAGLSAVTTVYGSPGPSSIAAPRAPIAVSASPGNKQVTISWAAPVDTGGLRVVGYTVNCSPGCGFMRTGGDATSAVFGGRTNGIPYTFTVMAQNAFGYGPVSAGVTAMPAPTVVPGPPTSVRAALNGGTAKVAWGPPVSTGDSALVNYTVTCSPSCGAPLTVAAGAPFTASFPGLAAGAVHTFWVSATNAAGIGPVSVAATVTTPPAPPATTTTVKPTTTTTVKPTTTTTVASAAMPSAPRYVSAGVIGRSIEISWAPPLQSGSAGPLLGYTATCSPGCGSKQIGASPSPWVMFDGLTIGSTYSVVVAARNAAGTGTPAPAVTATPVAAYPGVPTFRPVTVGSRSVSLTWITPWGNGSAPVTSFVVRCAPSCGAPFEVVASPTLVTRFTVPNLTTGNTYTFTVAAKNIEGEGVASAPVSATAG